MKTTEHVVLRTHRNKNYKTIGCDGLDDPRLSFKAKGLLMYLITRPDGWKFYRKQLISVSKDGRDAVIAGLMELRRAGYLQVSPIREGGKFLGQRWDVSETSMPNGFPEVRETRTTENPDDGNPVLRKTRTTNTNKDTTKKQDYNKLQEKTKTCPTPSSSVPANTPESVPANTSIVDGQAEESAAPSPISAAPPSKVTWMTPYWDSWVARFGKPVGRAAKTLTGKFATYLFPLIEKYGNDRVLRAWRSYLAQRKAVQPAWFAEQFKQWDKATPLSVGIAQPGQQLKGRVE